MRRSFTKRGILTSGFAKKTEKTPPHENQNTEGLDEAYQNFKVGGLLREDRKNEGITQEEVAKKRRTKKSVISRIDNHSADIRLSTLRKYAGALSKQIRLEIS